MVKTLPQPDVYPVRYPVLLCHGYGTIAGFVTPSPLHHVCMQMRKHGVMAFAPNIVPYARIEVRSAEWLKILGRIMLETSAPRVNIIAYSMGGLDIRHMVHKHNLADVVASVTTICTPHRGSSLAVTALNTPKIIRDQLLNITNMMGNKVYPDIPSDADGALHQLTRKHINESFNKKITDVPGIPYFSFSSACGKGTSHKINTPLRYFNNIIYENEGVNDGFVSKESAVYCDHIRPTYLSHLELIKLGLMREHRKEWLHFWRDVMNLLVEAKL